MTRLRQMLSKTRGYEVVPHIVFEDTDGVIHARYFTPETVCGIDVIAMRVEGLGKTHQLGAGLPLTRTTLPAVTCLTCITAMDI